jgi:CDP-6-deoxy-D-xylo-4-hexulose-3-dehydrase
MSSFALPVIARDQEGTARVRETIGRLGIESRPVVAGNLLRQPFVQGHDVAPYRETTPVADHVHDHGIYVGNGHHVTVGMVETLAHALGGDTT